MISSTAAGGDATESLGLTNISSVTASALA